MGLTNHTGPISHHIILLVINGLGGRHTNTDTHTHTYRHANKNDVEKLGACGQRHAPGLKRWPSNKPNRNCENSLYTGV